LLPNFTRRNHIHSRLGLEDLSPFRISQASLNEQSVQRHHRYDTQYNQIFHCCLPLIYAPTKSPTPVRSQPVISNNPGRDDPIDRIGCRALRRSHPPAPPL
jgi:hypothetical protein